MNPSVYFSSNRLVSSIITSGCCLFPSLHIVCTALHCSPLMQEYHVLLGPFMDYANLSIQFGYATMFIVAYPLAMPMCFVSNYIGAHTVW